MNENPSGSLSEQPIHTMLCKSGATSCDERVDEEGTPDVGRHRGARRRLATPPPPLMNWRNWIILVVGVTLVWASLILMSTKAQAAEWTQPYGGCKEATLAPHSAGAEECRAHGWTIMRRLAVNPHGVVKGSGLPACTFEDGSGGPLPCAWNFDGIHTGNDQGLAYWIGTGRHVHYVWAHRPAPISEGYAHWATLWNQAHLGLTRKCWVYRTKQDTWNTQCPDALAPFI